jgi:hypothetical protein
MNDNYKEEEQMTNSTNEAINTINTVNDKIWNVVVSNDDGIESEGIRHLIKALSQVADVYVCAPEGEQAQAGTASQCGTRLLWKRWKCLMPRVR